MVSECPNTSMDMTTYRLACERELRRIQGIRPIIGIGAVRIRVGHLRCVRVSVHISDAKLTTCAPSL